MIQELPKIYDKVLRSRTCIYKHGKEKICDFAAANHTETNHYNDFQWTKKIS